MFGMKCGLATAGYGHFIRTRTILKAVLYLSWILASFLLSQQTVNNVFMLKPLFYSPNKIIRLGLITWRNFVLDCGPLDANLIPAPNPYHPSFMLQTCL